MAEYSWRDGKRVAPGVLRDYDAMRAAFEKAFPGLTLYISDGRRTAAEQEAIFRARYVPSDQVGSRKVYDYRWWNGVLWARISSAGTVAVPGTSLHESDRALDIRDSGNDPGVTRYGNVRSLWIRNNAARFGFNPKGYTDFNEPWHIEYTRDPWFVPEVSGGGAVQLSTSGKEIKVITYSYSDGTAASKNGRILTPGAGAYLHTKAGAPASNATNIVGGIGPYSITPHVYATGTPGDIVEVTLVWQKVDVKPVKTSYHYVERLVIDKDGQLKASREFKRAVSRGYAVYVRVVAPTTNKNAVKITLLTSDAYLFVAA